MTEANLIHTHRRNDSEDDVVIEVKIRFSGLPYDTARSVRDILRQPDGKPMMEIIKAIEDVVTNISPSADIKAFSPWAEWRPARGRRRQ